MPIVNPDKNKQTGNNRIKVSNNKATDPNVKKTFSTDIENKYNRTIKGAENMYSGAEPQLSKSALSNSLQNSGLGNYNDFFGNKNYNGPQSAAGPNTPGLESDGSHTPGEPVKTDISHSGEKGYGAQRLTGSQSNRSNMGSGTQGYNPNATDSVRYNAGYQAPGTERVNVGTDNLTSGGNGIDQFYANNGISTYETNSMTPGTDAGAPRLKSLQGQNIVNKTNEKFSTGKPVSKAIGTYDIQKPVMDAGKNANRYKLLQGQEIVNKSNERFSSGESVSEASIMKNKAANTLYGRESFATKGNNEFTQYIKDNNIRVYDANYNTGHYINDLTENINHTSDFLKSQGIVNVNALSIKQIEKSLSTGTIGDINLGKNEGIKRALQEMLKLKKDKLEIDNIQLGNKENIYAFRQNEKTVLNFLDTKGIHGAKSLSTQEIAEAIKNGQIGDIKLNDGTTSALRELLDLKKMSKAVTNPAQYSGMRRFTSAALLGKMDGDTKVKNILNAGTNKSNIKVGDRALKSTIQPKFKVGQRLTGSVKEAKDAAVQAEAIKSAKKSSILRNMFGRNKIQAPTKLSSLIKTGGTGMAAKSSGVILAGGLMAATTMFIATDSDAMLEDTIKFVPETAIYNAYTEGIDKAEDTGFQQALNYSGFFQKASQKNIRSFDPASKESGVGLPGGSKSYLMALNHQGDAAWQERVKTTLSKSWYLLDDNSYNEESAAHNNRNDEFLNNIMREEYKTAYYNKASNTPGKYENIKDEWVKGVNADGKAVFEDEESIIGYDLDYYWGPKIFPYDFSFDFPPVWPMIESPEGSGNWVEDKSGDPLIWGQKGKCTIYGTAALRGNASGYGKDAKTHIYIKKWVGHKVGGGYFEYTPVYSTSYSNKFGDGVRNNFTNGVDKKHGCNGSNEYFCEKTDAYDKRLANDKYRMWNKLENQPHTVYKGCITTELHDYNYLDSSATRYDIDTDSYNDFVNGPGKDETTGIVYKNTEYKIGMYDLVKGNAPGTDSSVNFDRNNKNNTLFEKTGAGVEYNYDSKDFYNNIAALFHVATEGGEECVAFEKNFFAKQYWYQASRATNNLITYEAGTLNTDVNLEEKSPMVHYNADDKVWAWFTPFPEEGVPTACPKDEPMKGTFNNTYKAVGFLTTTYFDMGIQDMMRIDKTTDEYCHRTENHIYDNNDEISYKAVWIKDIYEEDYHVEGHGGSTNPGYIDLDSYRGDVDFEEFEDYVMYKEEHPEDVVQEEDLPSLDVLLNLPELQNLSNSQLIQALIDAGYSQSKAEAMAACFEALTQAGYSPTLAVAFMANINHEGALGMVQGTYQVLTTLQDLLDFKRQHGSDNGHAFGMCQWDGGRKTALLDLYIAAAQANGGVVSPQQMTQIECGYLIQELQSTESRCVEKINACTNAYDAAMACQKWFERPKSVSTKRGETGNNIATIINSLF